MEAGERILYEFGRFRISTGDRLLLRGSEVIPLGPKVIDTLLALLASDGRVLATEELIKAVWPDTSVERNGLMRNISLLRRALGDDAGESQYIETRSEEHTSELQSHSFISYAVFCL